METRVNTSRAVQFITCHGCGRKGHYKSDCPDQEKAPVTSSAKLVEVNLVQIADGPLITQDELKIMMAKRGRPSKEPVPTLVKRHQIRELSPTNPGKP